MDKKYCVLQVVPSMVTGGVERGTVEMVGALINMGWEAIVASSGGPMAREVAKLGGKHITIPLDSKNPYIMWQNVEKLAQVIDAFDVNIVHARSRAPAWSAWHAAHRTGKHFITTFHNAYGHETKLKRLYNSVMAKGELVIAISSFVAEHIKKVYKVPEKKIRLIPRGVDTGRFDRGNVGQERMDSLRVMWGAQPGLPLIIMPGRLTRWKGQHVFIEAISKLKNKDAVNGFIVGSGDQDYRQELLTAIKNHNLTDTVKLVSECKDMPAAFGISDIMVSSSTRPEGFGRVIVEAQAMGSLVIATNHGGAAETVKDGETGFLIPVNDAQKMAEAIEAALALPADERSKMTKKALAAVWADYTTKLMTERTMAVYDEILAPERMRAALPTTGGAADTITPDVVDEEEAAALAKKKKKVLRSKDVEGILVIRFGALGDLIMCRQAFHEIREEHKGAEIALLVSKEYEEFAKTMPWFDKIIVAERGPFWEYKKWLDLMTQLYDFRPKRVYDLQGKFRQNVIYWLMGGAVIGPEWSGAATGCSHPRPWPPAPQMHFMDFLAAQLRSAGVPETRDNADLFWLDAPIMGLKLPKQYALIIPGCSPKLIHKRWPAAKYAEVAVKLKEQGIDVIAIGTKTEAETIAEIKKLAPDVIDMSGQTTLNELGALAQRAVYTIGNDTGPVHLAAAVGSPTVAILSSHTDPVWSAPHGPKTAWIKSNKIEEVTVDEVFLALKKLSAS